MHVLAMCHAYPPYHNAGAEMTLHTELRHIAGRGHRVDVLLSRSCAAKTPYQLDGVAVHPLVSSGDPMRWFGTDRQPQVVIAHLENTLRAAALSDMFRVPMVHLLHNTHTFTKAALRRGPSQLAVFNTEWMREDFAADWEFHTSARMPPSVVVHPPVTGSDYATTPGSRISLINLNEDKGGLLFWQLAKALPGRKFLGVKGAYGPQVECPDSAAPNVEVIAHQAPVDMPAKVYGQTRILLMPSVYESYGRTAIEAAHSGIPTIAHPTPGLLEALGSAGTFVDRDDTAGWVDAINRLSRASEYAAASVKALELAAALNPERDLNLLCDEMEAVVRRGFATRIG